MAIDAYTGLPGSGKSYSAVERVILPALAAGHQVVTNIPIHQDKLPPEQAALLTQFDIQEVLEQLSWFQEVFPKGATLVLDEVWRLWPAGLTANKVAQEHKSFLAEHRHLVNDQGRSTEICLVTQDLGQVSAFARNLVNFTYRTTKLDAVGQDKRYRVDVYQGAATGPNPPEKTRLRQLYGSYKPEVYQYYKSQTMSDAQEHGTEKRTDDRSNIFKSPFWRVFLPGIAVAVLVVIYFGFSAVTSMYAPEEAPEPEPGTVVPRDPGGRPGLAPGTVPPPPPPPPAYKHFYDGMKAAIASNMGRFPWISYVIGFKDERVEFTVTGDQLAQLGYSLVAVSECFVQVKGHGSLLNVFCEPQQVQERDDSAGQVNFLPEL